jgi:hypothetical protein
MEWTVNVPPASVGHKCHSVKHQIPASGVQLDHAGRGGFVVVHAGHVVHFHVAHIAHVVLGHEWHGGQQDRKKRTHFLPPVLR